MEDSANYGTVEQWTPGEAPLANGESPEAGWDYVFVFAAPKTLSAPLRKQKKADAARLALLNDLTEAGFSYSQLWVPSSGSIIVRVALPEQVMMEKAELCGLSLRVRGDYGGGFLNFTQERARFFGNEERRLRQLPYFTPAERLLITQITIRSREVWGAAVNVNQLYVDGVLQQAFALHSRKEHDALVRASIRGKWWKPLHGLPLFALYEYLGPRIVLYFAWLLFYTRMLTGFAFFAIPVTILLYFSHSDVALRGWTQLCFGVATAFWSMYWIQKWQRRNAILNVIWGLSNDEDDYANTLRDDFDGIQCEGFYSRGGFVNLADLAESPIRSTISRSGHSDDSSFLNNMQQLDAVTSDALHHYNDYEADDGNFDPDVSVQLLPQRATLINLVRNERPSQEQVVFVGGGRDDDLQLHAPVARVKFNDLPIQRFCSRKLVRKRVAITSFITALFSLVVGGLSFCILFFRQELNTYIGLDRDSTLSTGILTAVLIIVSDNSWRFVSTSLT